MEWTDWKDGRWGWLPALSVLDPHHVHKLVKVAHFMFCMFHHNWKPVRPNYCNCEVWISSFLCLSCWQFPRPSTSRAFYVVVALYLWNVSFSSFCFVTRVFEPSLRMLALELFFNVTFPMFCHVCFWSSFIRNPWVALQHWKVWNALLIIKYGSEMGCLEQGLPLTISSVGFGGLSESCRIG